MKLTNILCRENKKFQMMNFEGGISVNRSIHKGTCCMHYTTYMYSARKQNGKEQPLVE